MNLQDLKETNKRLKEQKIKEIMSKFAISTTPNTTVTDLAHLLMRFKISGVPVLNINREIVGIVTATDLYAVMQKMMNYMEHNCELTSENVVYVRDIMTTDVCVLQEDSTVFEAIQLMCHKNVHTLPVMSGKEIIGIIGRRDVLNAFYSK